MNFGICLQSVVPVRVDHSHMSEMLTQVLFGELYRIIESEEHWIRIQLAYDNYEGWIHQKQSFSLDEEEFLRLIHVDTSVSIDLVQLLSNETRSSITPILLGSSLPGITDEKFSIAKQTFIFEGLKSNPLNFDTPGPTQNRQNAKQTLIDDALLYFNAPYLWGGRTPFGIDCSGLTQMVYKLKKIKLLRDVVQQAKQGEPINFIAESEPGDLAFFDDEEGNITHVGLLINKEQILHASGHVRIDKIDHEGIFNEEEKRYTYKLRMIKRII